MANIRTRKVYARNVNPNSVHAFKTVEEMTAWCDKNDGWRITADEAYELTQMNSNSVLMLLNGTDYEKLPSTQSELLEALVKHSGWNKRQFANMCGMNPSRFSHILHGDQHLPIKDAKHIAQACGFNWWDLYIDE